MSQLIIRVHIAQQCESEIEMQHRVHTDHHLCIMSEGKMSAMLRFPVETLTSGTYQAAMACKGYRIPSNPYPDPLDIGMNH